MGFSAFDRPAHIDALKSQEFDLLIIGGGITGCGIALDAASRGLKTALIEKNDFAYGTSSRSTKLIHGGLRYLKQLEFGLVKEIGSERAIVHRLAPHLVIPEKMLLPLTERTLGATLTSIGLKIYDWLAGVKREDRRRMLTRQQTLKCEPLLKRQGIKGGALYAEYRTDDARLTIEVAKTAFGHGALLLNYVKAMDFLYSNGKVNGVVVNDELKGGTFEVSSRAVVNATGPWVDELREINLSKGKQYLHLTKGIHIVLPFHKLPVRQSIYFDVTDGRMIFAIPRGRTTYVGTTDTAYTGNKDAVAVDAGDVDYLIRAVNDTFSGVNITRDDVESSWCGLRPLIHEEGKSASELSRKDEIFESDSGLISIAGGKLTGYRKMAERTVDLVVEEYLEAEVESCHTEEIKLTEEPFDDYDEVSRYIHQLSDELESRNISRDWANYLVSNYGRAASGIISQVKDNDPQSMLLAELNHCLEREMTCKPADFLMRRTGRVYFYAPQIRETLIEVLDEFSRRFSWTPHQREVERTTIESLIRSTTNFK